MCHAQLDIFMMIVKELSLTKSYYKFNKHTSPSEDGVDHRIQYLCLT